MKKVGICTLYYAHNFGAILQAFALQEVLKSFGYDAEFLKIKEPVRTIKPEDIAKSNYNSFEKSIEYLNVCKNLYNMEEYDAIIVGSDEIWNVKNGSFEHLDEYLGYNLNTKNLIAYAPSANLATVDLLKDVYKDKLSFSKFNSISVRDAKTAELVKEVSGRDAEIVLDPTLLIESYDKYMKYKEPDKKNYIVVYGYEFSQEERKKIKAFAEENNKTIYSLGFRSDWCERLDADIFEFLGYMKNADYTISNSFHGLLFSIILKKNFAVFSNNSVKVNDILDKFGLRDRDGFEKDDLSEIFNKEIDYDSVNKIIVEQRTKSLEFLKNALD